jgi:hypothetical protein
VNLLRQITTVIAIVVAGAALQSQRQGAERAMLADPLCEAVTTRPDMVAGIRSIPVEERDAADLDALLSEVASVRAYYDCRGAIINAGKVLPKSAIDGEDVFQLLDTIAQHHTPRVIGALVLFIGSGNRVTTAIAEFGEQAIAELLVVADGDDPLDVGGALFTFHKMLTVRSVRHPLSANSRAQIIERVRRRLSGPQGYAIAMPAIRLAVATRDPSLLQRVKALAADPRVASDLGIENEERRQALRNFAAKELRDAEVP